MLEKHLSKSILTHYISNCFQLFQSAVESNMDDISEDDMCDSQFNDIGENYLTESQFRELTMEWCESDTQFNDIVEDWSQGDSFSQSDETDKKRKSSEIEADGQMSAKRHKSVIVPNLQLNAGNNTDPSIIFRPWEDKYQGMENLFGVGNKADSSHHFEPEKEKNPQPEKSEIT